ncbi:hypothetical protein B0H66DRAFT_220123 [Apodospora peruviana]|uniref:Uncharacterized protein n=1 Tax=Apodospora peruviana TaxID=516989 RepID=A0AAE0I5H6_9PEZI|nr:hypothetical protein B0H66DRAFT_220123 [Apodospora peruviana]
MQCTTESRAQFWDSRKPGPQDDWLDDAQLVIKLPVISTIWSSDPKPSDKDASILLVTSTGDPMDNSDSKLHPQPLNISLTLLERLVETSQLSSPYTRTVLATRGFHMSHHLQYGAADGKPSGVTVLFRFPRNSSSITCVLRLRLADYACVCLLFCRDDQVLHDLRRRFTEEASLLRRNPLHILTFVFAHRKETFDKWLKEIAYDVSEAETASGMVPLTWKRSQLRPGRLSHLQDLDKPNLLSHLFSTHTRLCHSELVAQYGIKFGKFCLEVVDMVERYRTAAGFPETRLVDRSDWEEAIRFTLGRWELVQDKVSELLQRLRGQCDVAHSPA